VPGYFIHIYLYQFLIVELNYYTALPGVVSASGKDRIDFFNRMSTNDLLSLPEGEYRKTVFTSDKGRIVALVTLISLPGETIMLTHPQGAERLIPHLDKYIIMDDVALTDNSPAYKWWGIYGDNALIEANRLFNINIGGNKVTREENIYFFADNLKAGAVHILAKSEQAAQVEQKLSGITRMDDEAFTKFRIKNGIPGENELNEQVNPMECGLNEFISFNKGCYIGQEVVARLDAQGKLPKQMIYMESGEAFKADDKLYMSPDEWKDVQPAALQREVGFISSAVNDENNTIGLGFIRSTHLDYGKGYIAGENRVKINIKKL
jgi:folate-binding protein YgfZ